MKADQVITITLEDSKLLGELVQKHIGKMVRRREIAKMTLRVGDALRFDAEVRKAKALLCNFHH